MLASGFSKAAASGMAFSLLGISCRFCQLRGLKPVQIITLCGLLGLLAYGSQIHAPLAEIPLRVHVLGIIVGLSQYGAITLVNAALKRGPLSSIWCVIGLSFVPGLLYAALVFGEPVSVLQGIGVASAMLCVFSASRIGNSTTAEEKTSGVARESCWTYLLLLMTLYALNSFAGIAAKDLGLRLVADGRNMMEAYGSCYFAMMYLVLTITAGLNLWHDRPAREHWGTFVSCGSVAACGSMAGVYFMGACAALPAAMAFATSAVFSILGAASAGVLLFGERISPAWLATMALGLVTVVCGAC